jgi:biotin carboxyl carrier protein
VGVCWTIFFVEPRVKLRDTSSGRQFEVELKPQGAVMQAHIDGAVLTLAHQPLPDGAVSVDLDGLRMRAFAARLGESIIVSVGPHTFEFKLDQAGRRGGRHSLATPQVTAPMPGKVLKIAVREGDQVEAGQPLITMEAMKMETTLAAEGPARVMSVRVSEGQMVDAGALLMELSPLDSSKPQSAP